MSMWNFNRAGTLAIITLAMTVGSATASGMGISNKIKAKLILSTLAYERNLPDKAGDTVDILVVGNSAETRKIEASLQQYTSKKIATLPIIVTTADSDTNLPLDKNDVLITVDTQLSKTTLRQAHAKGIDTITLREKDVAAGYMIGIVDHDGKTHILINNDAIAEGRANFKASFLRIAKPI